MKGDKVREAVWAYLDPDGAEIASRRISLNLDGRVFEELEKFANRLHISLSKAASLLLGPALAEANEVLDEAHFKSEPVGLVLTAQGQEIMDNWLEGVQRSTEEILAKYAELCADPVTGSHVLPKRKAFSQDAGEVRSGGE